VGSITDLALESRQHLLEGLLDIAAHDSVVALDAVPEIAVFVPVRLVPRREMPYVPGRDRAEVQRILARVKTEADHHIVGVHTPPQLHGLVVAPERDVSIGVRVVASYSVCTVDRPDGWGLQKLRELGGQLSDARAPSGLRADVDDHPASARKAWQFVDEAVGVDLVEGARPFGLGHVDLHLLRKDVGVKRDGHRLRLRQDRLRLLELRLQLRDVVDDDAGVAQLRSQLRDHVHPMLRHVLQRREPDRQCRVERDDVDGGDVVQLGVGDAARSELGGGAGGRQAAGDLARREVVAERDKARHVLPHRLHARRAVADLLEPEQRLEMLGDVDEAAAVYAGEEGDPPLPQRVDQREVSTGLLKCGAGPAGGGSAHVFLLVF
jgi:hypothetical protein